MDPACSPAVAAPRFCTSRNEAGTNSSEMSLSTRLLTRPVVIHASWSDEGTIREPAAAGDGTIAVAASGTLVRYLLTEGLPDELRLLVHPIVAVAGRHLLEGGGGKVPLNLAEARPHGNGVVALRYTRAD